MSADAGQVGSAIAVTAFWVGVVSAVSLPLGALTTRLWVPEDRTVAALMAFGGGALLAALSVDLVAPALHHGHYPQIAAGAVLGGLIFVLLNEVVNDYGGFVRKVSTRVYHLRRQQHQRYRSVLSRLRDLDIFGEVERRDFRAVAAFIEVRNAPRGTHLYRDGDPGDGLYILARGKVSLLDPKRHMSAYRTVAVWETFARMPFLTGAPHDDSAVVTEDAEIWFLPREKFLHLLVSSPRLGQAVHSWLRDPKTFDYLIERQSMDSAAAAAWLDATVHDLIRHATVPPACAIVHNEDEFVAAAADLGRTTLFHGLPLGELQTIADRLIFKQRRKGDAFFHAGETADRVYIVAHGEVTLLDPRDPTRSREMLSDKAVFGIYSFVTGAPHSATAIAAEDTSFWVLLRRDLPALLPRTPVFRSQLEGFIGEACEYLDRRHGFDPDKTQRWAQRMRTDIGEARPLAAVADLIGGVRNHHGAALAIWLGILLDGIPESLVLGTIQAKSSISLSLIAGLFISNYPESLSSSLGMKHQGLSFGRVLLMWSSLVLITGAGAALGALFFGDVAPDHFAVIEGIAAGAMLTMIAQTMLPEAYFKGGNVVGLATLMGFLTALFFRELG